MLHLCYTSLPSIFVLLFELFQGLVQQIEAVFEYFIVIPTEDLVFIALFAVAALAVNSSVAFQLV